ncbi:MAG: DEAD/DEAH box helicase [Candidatus Wildermuthbacteria bacterium]|nr:DEAD/DEAH box helicase [Candidatus Wildermuthbacteria bacterium]
MEYTYPDKTVQNLLIVAITPYFLEKGNVWFEENLQKILAARKTQPFFQDNVIFLEVGQTYPLTQLLRRIDELGYEKVFQVQDLGEFAHRGGIVEIFPINTSHPIQIEFKGNTIEYIHAIAGKSYTEGEEQKIKEILKKRLKSQRIFSDLKGLKPGDYVVHLDHGVARFAGIAASLHTEYQIPNTTYYELEYAAGDKLFVPVGLERKLSRYVGFAEPHISRLGSLLWQKTKKRIWEEVEKMAKQLLELYAKREVTMRPPYLATNEIGEKVTATFPYQETPDQTKALEDIKHDVSGTRPMDRIVCGDVGFGKTEIALRTMVMAVENGYQTALLAPTTILAYQHFQNFQSRLKNLPFRIALLSRLQSKKEQRQILSQIENGQIDMVIGTHRLLSSDVKFRNLGLLVIDDEQRFGVKQKEKLREMRASLDVLSLSATPIPRTLYMALSSLKNISLIYTPPAGRMPVQIAVAQRKEKTIKQAIETELKRSGQIYYLHNRIGTIEEVKKYLEKIVPSATIGIAHARMKEKTLIRIVDEFREKKFDMLVATTIIENGLDLPNVNTLIADDATKLGLAQAYQIRGRIGRGAKTAYAYFLYGARKLGEKVKLRLDALKEAGELGSGYRIAMRDLEIRGAGNILGREQSGSVNAVGLNLYCQMLSEAVEKLKPSDQKV